MTLTRNLDARDVLNQIVNDPRYAEVMRVPVFSGPQILLAGTALALFGFSTAAAIAHTIPLWLAMVFNLIAVYLAFTPLHDASHRAVSSNSFLNDLIGVIPGQLLLPGINMTAFRAIHMDHHRYVGQEGRDPDTAFVRLPFGGVFYLMFADIHWVFWYLEYGRHYWSRKVAFYMVLLLVMVIGIHAAFLMSPTIRWGIKRGGPTLKDPMAEPGADIGGKPVAVDAGEVAAEHGITREDSDRFALRSHREYFRLWGLDREKLALAAPGARVMHPGPMNRGVEIDSAVVDGKQSVILPQVTFGIAVRMAVMSIVAGNEA